MPRIKGLSLSVLALAVAVTAIADTSAQARTVKHHKATHFSTSRGDRVYGAGPYGAYGAIPGPAIVAPSSPGFGYGYGDNSHGCGACAM